jgi:hypothetical protein
VSAVWHGFYPGYYLMFTTYALVSATSRQLYRHLVYPLPHRTRAFLLFIPNWLIVDYIMPPFVLLTWEKSVLYYRRNLWWGHVACLITLAGLSLCGVKRKTIR